MYFDAVQKIGQPTLREYYNGLYTELWHCGKHYHNGGLLERTRSLWAIENTSINGDIKSMELLLADWEEANRAANKMTTLAERNDFELLKPILGTLIDLCKRLEQKINKYNNRVDIYSCYEQTEDAKKYDGYYKRITKGSFIHREDGIDKLVESDGWQKMKKEEEARVTYDDLKQHRVVYLYYGNFVDKLIDTRRVTISPQWGKISTLIQSLKTQLEDYYKKREAKEQQRGFSYQQIQHIYKELSKRGFISGGSGFFYCMYSGDDVSGKLEWKLRPKRNKSKKQVSVLYELLWLLGKNREERKNIVNTYFEGLSYSRFSDTVDKPMHKYSTHYDDLKRIIDAAKSMT